MYVYFASPIWTEAVFSSSHEQLDPGLEELQFASIYLLYALLSSQDALMGLVKQLLSNGSLNSVPPGAQLGSPLKHVQATAHRLSMRETQRPRKEDMK